MGQFFHAEDRQPGSERERGHSDLLALRRIPHGVDHGRAELVLLRVVDANDAELLHTRQNDLKVFAHLFVVVSGVMHDEIKCQVRIKLLEKSIGVTQEKAPLRRLIGQEVLELSLSRSQL